MVQKCPKCSFTPVPAADCPKCGINLQGYQRYLAHHSQRKNSSFAAAVSIDFDL